MEALELEKIEASAQAIADLRERVMHLVRSAWDIRRSHPKVALRLSARARQLAETDNYTEGIAYSYRNTGTAYYILSQHDQALADLEKALALFTDLGDQHAIGTTLRNIGNVYHGMQLSEASIEAYEKALAITCAENDLQGMSYNLGNIGYVYLVSKEYDKALPYLLQAKEILEKINDALGLSDLLNNLGRVQAAQRDFETAEKNIRRARELAASINHLRGLAGTQLSLGLLLLEKKQVQQAIEELQKAHGAGKEVGEVTVLSDILLALSEAHERDGNYSEALKYFKEYERNRATLHETGTKVLRETFKLKSEIERSNLEKEFYKKENSELEAARQEIEAKNKDLERLSIVARETVNPILILDADGTIDWVNSSFERLNGCSLLEFKRRYGNTIQEASNNSDIENILKKCAETRQPLRYESPNYLDNGKVVWEATTLTPIFNHEGKLVKYIIIDDDVTDRKVNEEIIRQKNKDITDSILYARQLQEAIMPPISGISEIFPESFVLFKPKDIVSGDFYWYSTTREVCLLAVADCTGHGVPGAFMSVIGNELLDASVRDPSIQSPSATFDQLDQKIKAIFAKGRQYNQRQDGMDAAMLVWHRNDNLIQFTGAKRPIIHIRNKKVTEYSGDRLSIGGDWAEKQKEFTCQTLYAEPGDLFYLFSDGFADQFGGAKGKKFMHKNFVQLLCDISELPMPAQKEKLEQTFEAWKGDLDQVDDVSVVGIKIRK